MKRDDLLMRVYIIHKLGFIIYKKKVKLSGAVKFNNRLKDMRGNACKSDYTRQVTINIL